MKNNYEIFDEYLGGKREDNLSKEETYMLQAVLNSVFSNDPSTQVGACYVDKNDNIITLGYNHEPRGWDIDEFPWNSNILNGIENTKYPYIIHAEMDAIINYKGDRNNFIDSTLYVTLFPCSNCAKHIVEAGVKKIVFLNEREENLDKIETKRLLNACGVEYISFKDMNRITKSIELDLNKDEKHNIKIMKLNKKANN